MDIKMNYIEKGEGKPLIMIHGNEESCVYFNGQFDYFAEKGFRCIAPDSRAHGDTPRGTVPLTIRQMTEDTLAFMAGEEDLILKEHTELIASMIPGARLAFCPGDHFCARENPEAFNAIVGPFLAD